MRSENEARYGCRHNQETLLAHPSMFSSILQNHGNPILKAREAIAGIAIDEFIRRNADSIWLHRHEMWEYMMDQPEERVEFHGRGP